MISDDQFCKSFEASIEKSHKQYYKHSFDPTNLDFTKRTSVDVVAIHMPKENLGRLLGFFDQSDLDELMLRIEHPAVKQAWEKYVTILNLVGHNKRV
jgi:hypothetical protein